MSMPHIDARFFAHVDASISRMSMLGREQGGTMGWGALVLREVPDEPYSTTTHGVSDARADDARGDDDPDAIEELGDEIASLTAHVHAVTQRLLALIGKFDRVRGWERGGHASCAHWLSARCGISLGTAREKVRAARALESLPLIRAAMARGELSFCQVRSLTRAATLENEAQLLPLARGATVSQLERMIRGWRKGSRQDEAQRERDLHESRTLSIFPSDEGDYVIKGRLTPEIGALLMRVIEAASDALYRANPTGLETDEQRYREAGQRRSDAIGLVAERALAAGFGGGGGGAEAPISGTSADRYQVVVHVSPETLSAEGEAEISEIEDGTRVSCETSQRLACDASVVRVAQKSDGTVLDVGRKARTVRSALRRTLEIRDRGCRFPGCGRRFTDAHHVKHWARGGETSLENCLLLCRHHHRLVHEGGWEIRWAGAGRPLFFDPRGGLHYEGGWQPPLIPADAVQALLDENASLGIEPDAWTASARWPTEADVPKEVYLEATGAI
jgi:hypothetical protein